MLTFLVTTLLRSVFLYFVSGILHILCVELMALSDLRHSLMYESISNFYSLTLLSMKDVKF